MTGAVTIGDVAFANSLPFALIAGPCQAEGVEHSVDIAGRLAELCAKRSIGFVFKASWDKANRTSGDAPRGLGMGPGLECLAAVRKQVGCPVITDVHEPHQCADVAASVDALQIPAFLCRQTDLLVAAGDAGKPVMLKKGQWVAPADMAQAAEKVEATGNGAVMLAERGTSFGYGNLVVDYRGLQVMQDTGHPVLFDATHSVQRPGALGVASGGERKFVPALARAAVAVGVAGIFIETHPNPATAPSDGPCMVPLGMMAEILDQLKAVEAWRWRVDW